MNSYNSSLTNAYSDRQATPLSRSERPAINKNNRPISETVREGQQLRGEIINRTTTDVTIRLSNGQTLQARLDASVPLSIGQTASFEVTHADPALISLRILQEEAAFAQNALIEKALTAADLPVTSRNAEIVNALLQHNLPISKESIFALLRQSTAHQNADLNTLALLTQHKLPINQATLTQFDAYQNYEHQILPQLENLAYSLGELAASSEPAMSGLLQTLEQFFRTPVQEFSSANASSILPDTPALPTDSVVSTGTSLSQSQEGSAILESNLLNSPLPQDSSAQLPVAPEHATPADSTLLQTQAQTAPADTALPNSGAFTTLGTNNTSVTQDIPMQPVTTSEAFAADPGAAQVTFGSAPPGTAAQSTAPETIPQTTMPEAGSQSVVSQDSLVSQLLSRWTLSPKDLADPDKVKEFYNRLREDLAELRSALRFVQKKDAPETALERLLSDTASATGRLQDNLEFMNMLNRFFPYIQLPIRFSDKTAHGELYVYTKKEKLRSESGSISVLLHLDMEALGPTDVYLSLTGNQLNSRFYLNNSAQEALFTEHLPELKETLSEKGFTVNFELAPRKQEEDPVRDFLNSHDTSGLSRFSFDCRA